MKLPAIFKQDIQSKNIQLIPLLIIERESGTAHLDENSIFLSTHDITVQRSDDDSTGLPYLQQGQGLWDDGMYFSPLLLDNPVISEKIDVENRKYTISKCTFKISNNPYNGQRFSDMLREDSLIGKKVNFVYKSINSSFPVGSMYLNSQGLSSWGDLYDDNEYVSPTFYFGEIRDIKHNNEVVTITAEDLGASFLHQELPKNSLPSNSSVIESNRGAKIPMVYGYVPKSPVVMGANNKIYADSRPIEGWFKNDQNNESRYNYPFDSQDFGALFVNIDDHYCCVADTIKYRLATNINRSSDETYFNFRGYDNEPTQVEYIEDDTYDSTEIAKLVDNPLLSMKAFQLMVAYKPSSISLLQRVSETVSWNDSELYPNRFSLGDSDYFFESEDNLLEQEFKYMTDGDYTSTIDLAENDAPMPNRAEAMINSVNHNHIEDNQWKHTLFRFVINTEPPIEYINRGGISRSAAYGTYWHWISFGHWVMPEQSTNEPDASHHIYTYAKRGMGTGDRSFERIRRRFREAYYNEDPDVQHYEAYKSYMLNEDMSTTTGTTFGNSIYLGDIIRFSDFHDDTNFNSINPEQVDWHNFENNGKSPLQYYSASTIHEGAGDFHNEYVNPFAKFTNQADKGKYIVDIGTYGWTSSADQSNSDGYSPNGTVSNYSTNFDYHGKLKGWLPEVNCLSVCDTKVTFKDMYGSVVGRVDSDNNLIKHPSDIIADIFVNELGYSPDKIDVESLELTKGVNDHGNYEFCFTQKDAINSKDLIEDIAKSTFIFPRIGFDGTLKFPQIKQRYEQEDLDNSIVIDDLDIINYSYNLTKRQELRTGTELKYNYDYHTENYFGDSETNNYNGSSIYNMNQVGEDELSFNGLNNIEDHIQEFESKYMRTELNYDPGLEVNHQINTIKDFQYKSTQHYRNRHLIIKCKLPLKYLNIDVGEYVRFNKLIDGVKAYGIDYSKTELLNNQYLYPLFMCTNIKKTIEYVEIECLQLHHLRNADGLHGSPIPVWFNIDDNTIPSVYYEPGQTVDAQDEDEVIDDQVIDDEVIVEEVELSSFSEAQYIYTAFNLTQGETVYPYGAVLDSEYLFIMDVQEGYEFGDEGSGIHSLFSPNNFKVRYNDSDEFVILQSWNDLLDNVIVTSNILDYNVLEIVHFNYTFNFNYTYKLKNIQTNVEEPIQLGWELIVNTSDMNFNNGKIIAAPFIDDLVGGHQFTIKNKCPYTIKYNSPHPVEYQEIPDEQIDIGGSSFGSGNNVLGDINNDGIVDVLDLVELVNNVMTEQNNQNTDLNQDGVTDVLDVVSLVTLILEDD